MGARAIRASGDGVRQHAFHRLEVSDLGADVDEVRLGNDANLGAWPPALVGQLQQRSHLVDREAEAPGAADERQALHVVDPVQAIAARAPDGRRQEPDPLVVADRLDPCPVRSERRPIVVWVDPLAVIPPLSKSLSL
jgi:hypothetical protein